MALFDEVSDGLGTAAVVVDVNKDVAGQAREIERLGDDPWAAKLASPWISTGTASVVSRPGSGPPG